MEKMDGKTMDIVAENVGKLKEMFPEAFTEDGSYGTTKDTKNTNEKILFKDECYEIQGAIFEVYREMGCGFLESVYQEGLEKELSKRGIPFVAQQELQLIYKGEPLQQTYRPDLICYGQIIVELKAVKDIAPEHKAQVINYLKATGIRLGLLVNSGTYPKASITRLAL